MPTLSCLSELCPGALRPAQDTTHTLRASTGPLDLSSACHRALKCTRVKSKGFVHKLDTGAILALHLRLGLQASLCPVSCLEQGLNFTNFHLVECRQWALLIF